MKNSIFLIFLLLQFVWQTAMAAPDTRSISGVVSDETGEPLIGATVQIEGTSTGVTTDLDGNFKINAANGQTIQVSYIGMVPQKIKVTPATQDLKIVLKTNAEVLDDVVVIGYGTMKKKDLTGAITQIDPNKIADSNPANVQDLLRGTPGLQIGYDTSAKGGGSMELRGKNSLGTDSTPLIILDGMQFYGELSEINPEDIKQIDILKDSSSAAIYGAKAANGVIIVTTKKGSNTGKPSVTLSANWGFVQKSAGRRMFTPDEYTRYRSDWLRYDKNDTYAMTEDGQYLPYQKGTTQMGYFDNPDNLSAYGVTLEEWLAYTGNTTEDNIREVWGRRIGMNDSQTVLDNFIANRTYDWYNDAFRTGVNQDYNVSLSGGTDKMNYYMSFGYMNNQGVWRGDDFSTYRASMRMSGKVTNWLEVGGNVNFQHRKDKIEDNNSGKTTRVPDYGQYWYANNLRLSPFSQKYDENGELIFYPMGSEGSRGVVYSQYDAREQYHKWKKGFNVLNSKFYVNVYLPANVTYQFNVSPRYEYGWRQEFWSADEPFCNKDDKGVDRWWQKKFDWTLNNTLSWDYTFNDVHHVQLTAVQEAESRRAWSDEINSRNITPTDALGYHNTQNGDKEKSSFRTNDWKETADALLARAFYSFDNRYMITASVRRDGYSAFGASHPHATFPSVALAWNFANEKFMQSVNDWWNTGKLRLSYGKNGNRDIGDVYKSLANLGSGEGATMGYITSDGKIYDMKYLMMDRLGNPDLRWERTTAYNVGLDFGFLNNRLYGSIDWYYKSTDDMIMGMRLPNFSGFSNVTTNIGQVDNTGFEISLNSVNITNANFEWTTSLAFSYNKNTIKHINYEMEDILDEEGNVIGQKEMDDQGNKWFIGKSIGQIWDYEVDGIWQVSEAAEAAKLGQRPGDPKVKNNYTGDDIINEDGTRTPVYNDKDKKFLGDTRPPMYLSMRNDFVLWKDFSISFTLYGYFGHKSTDTAYLNNDNGGDLLTHCMNTYYKQYWTVENPSDLYGRIGAKGPAGCTSPSRLMNRNFIRLSDLSLGYTIPQKWTRKAAIERLRVSASIKNLFTIHHKDWVYGDPESGGLGIRSFNLGINVTF